MSTQISELPQPYQVNVVALVLTLHCNATCSHCCFECGPHRKRQMSVQQVDDYVEQIAGIETVNAIVVTGGEVFTRYELLRATIETAGRYGLKSRIVTNGSWATSAKRALQKLQPLVEAGLATFNISFDAVHEQFVKPLNVKHALEAALALGLEVAISHVSLREPRAGAAEKLLQTLDLPKDAPITVLQAHINPGGRALRKYPLDQMALVDGESAAGQRLHESCSYVLREPVITPNGNFAACCGTTVTTSNGFREEFVIGSLNERPLVELVEELEFNPLYTALMTEGPWYFYHRLHGRDPELFPRKRFVDICDLCAQVICNEGAQRMLQEILDEHEPGLLLKKMMLEVARQEKLGDNLSVE